jgi:hypothetical protein
VYYADPADWKGERMLGTALTEILQSLAEIPADKRTKKQKALFEELALLYVASRAPSGEMQDERLITLHAELRSQINIQNLGSISVVVRPKPKVAAGNCPLCGQPRPA